MNWKNVKKKTDKMVNNNINFLTSDTSQFQGAFHSLNRLLSSFSSVVSRLISLSLLALVCLVLQILFLSTVASRESGAAAEMGPTLTGLAVLFAIALAVSHLLEGKVGLKGSHRILMAMWRKDSWNRFHDFMGFDVT